MKKLNISLIALAVTAGAVAIVTQINKKGAGKTVGDLKDGGTKVLKTIKDSPAGKVAAKVIGTIGKKPDNDVAHEEQLQDDQVTRAHG